MEKYRYLSCLLVRASSQPLAETTVSRAVKAIGARFHARNVQYPSCGGLRPPCPPYAPKALRSQLRPPGGATAPPTAAAPKSLCTRKNLRCATTAAPSPRKPVSVAWVRSCDHNFRDASRYCNRIETAWRVPRACFAKPGGSRAFFRGLAPGRVGLVR